MSADQPVATGADRFAVSRTADHFAWIRTRLALERTLMAWVRTAIALIGFGFSIVEIFNRLAVNPNVAPALQPEMPRYIGLAMIGAGVLGGAISCVQYLWIGNYLWSTPFQPIAGVGERRIQTPGLVIGIGLTLIGLLAFVTVLLRVA